MIPLFLLLVAFRILNAAALRTFFQPDEFFQSLEPAWQLAFGENASAWITWVGDATDRRQFPQLTLYLVTGMETSPSILASPTPVRRRLLRRREPRAVSPAPPRDARRASHRRSQDDPSHHRRCRGLLHVETRASRLR